MGRRKTSLEIAEATTLKLVEGIKKKVDLLFEGDTSAAPTDQEIAFLQSVIKTAQEGEKTDAVVSYLSEMSDDELDAYHEKLRKKLEEGSQN